MSSLSAGSSGISFMAVARSFGSSSMNLRASTPIMCAVSSKPFSIIASPPRIGVFSIRIVPDLAQARRQLPYAQTVKLLRAARTAQSDHAHLGETALHISHQGGVNLYAIEHNHAVDIEHMAIDIGGQSLRGLAHLDGFRAGQHGRSHGLRCKP